MSPWPEPLAGAYAACEALARSHYENFPVASRLLPRVMRPHIAAVYAFARVADDIADEGAASPAQRLERLGAWQRRLHAAVEANRSPEGFALQAEGVALQPEGVAPQLEDSIVAALAHSIRSLDLPMALFDNLVSAFGQDTMTSRYASWADVFDYCRRSANPIGRLVLRIAGYTDDALDRSSDALCTALQLTNFWQDLGRDWQNGRLYIPREVAAACGAREEDLGSGLLTDAWTCAIGQCVTVTDDQFRAGRMVCDGVRGRLRYELRITWLGGRRILERVSQRSRRLMIDRPALGARDVPVILGRAACWSSQT
ncbi:MAG: squalene synthase HpnC [Vicinamibacterales bacterium]